MVARRLEQGYLAITDAAEIRIRRADGRDAWLTVKSAPGLSRVEEELALDAGAFERLWPLTKGRRLVKVRHTREDAPGVVFELDVYEGALAGLSRWRSSSRPSTTRAPGRRRPGQAATSRATRPTPTRRSRFAARLGSQKTARRGKVVLVQTATEGPSMSLRRSLIAALLVALLAPAAASADRLTVRGTQVFKSVVPDLQTQFGNELVTFNGFVYFVANDDVHGNELWRTDGTNEGTALVSDIYPGLPNTNSNPHRLTVVGDRLYFNAYNATTQSPETVYYIDAAAPTTVKLAKARLATGGAAITAVGSLFGAPNGRRSSAASWPRATATTRCTPSPGRHRVEKITVGAENINIMNRFSPAATAGGWTYYKRGNMNVSPGQGGELWRTNGSVTESVADIYPGNGGSGPSAFVATSNKVYFTADDGSHGRELWVTNPGNKADTHIVHEHVPGTAATSINDPGQVANGNILYYVPANDPVTGPEVWRTDGTDAGTRVVKDITPGAGGLSRPRSSRCAAAWASCAAGTSSRPPTGRPPGPRCSTRSTATGTGRTPPWCSVTAGTSSAASRRSDRRSGARTAAPPAPSR